MGYANVETLHKARFLFMWHGGWRMGARDFLELTGI